MGASKIMSPGFTQEDYKNLLAKLWKAHEAIEPVLSNFKTLHQNGLESKERLNKRFLLKKDLKILEQPLPPKIPAIEIDTDAQAWGAMYVLEGSMLGGAIIYKQLSENNTWPVQTFEYYNFYGSQTGYMWATFKKFLERENSEQNVDDVLEGAQKAYRVFLASAQN